MQIENSIVDLIAWALPDPTAVATVRKAVAPQIEALPRDERPKPFPHDEHGTFRRVAQAVQQSFVEATVDLARSVGVALTTPENLPSLVGACAASAGNASACVDAFIDRFGARALRKPVADDERALLRSIYGDATKIDPAGFADVIGTLLASPQALYFLESGGTPVDEARGIFLLAPHELASRLSFHFWDTIPDDELWAAASDGTLLAPDTFRATVARLSSAERARTPLSRFYSEWMLLDEVPAFDNLAGEAAFRTFVGAGVATATLRDAAIAEALALTTYVTWTKPGSFDELLTSPLAFATGDLAKLYKVPAWDGNTAPSSAFAGVRPGFLTRAAFLASGEVATRPILRGVLLRTKFLCDEIPPPPPNAFDLAEEASAKLKEVMTTRERTVATTEAISPACAGCHQRYINPLAYALEGFDSLGRLRTEERIIRHDGTVAGTLPVDTKAVPRVTPDDASEVRGAAELVGLIKDSGRAHACFARHVVRYAFARVEDPERDACAIDTVTAALREGKPLAPALASVAFTPAFTQRSFGGQP